METSCKFQSSNSGFFFLRLLHSGIAMYFQLKFLELQPRHFISFLFTLEVNNKKDNAQNPNVQDTIAGIFRIFIGYISQRLWGAPN